MDPYEKDELHRKWNRLMVDCERTIGKFITFLDTIVYYSIGFTKSTSKFWRQINKSGGTLGFVN